ncbi:hypothetical protein [Bacillus sp. FJAT-45350]|uniref:hypothetical protein n=1 Tax=Bacillus sp. FJAT-45350 TaxID=2011014 RepID=UPI000BB88538|nr:hypothetical protein [Bacillus sp. FJAT-45350]
MNKKKKFGLDIDGTITHPATFIPYLNKHFNKSITLDDIKEYDLTKVLHVTQNDFWDWLVKHEHSIYSEAILAEHVEDALTFWKESHHMIYISARGNHLHQITTNWFETRKLPYDHIELIGQHDKINAVKEHQLDIFFEDKHDNACDIAEECDIPVILMDTPYNRLSTPKNVVRANDWREAKDWVDNWLKNNG